MVCVTSCQRVWMLDWTEWQRAAHLWVFIKGRSQAVCLCQEVLLRFLHRLYLLTGDVTSLRSYVLIAEVGVCFERLVALRQIIAPCSFISTWMSHNVCLQVKIIQHHNLLDIKVRTRYSEVTVLRFVFTSWTVRQRAAHHCVFYIQRNCNREQICALMSLDVETEPFIWALAVSM